MTPTDIARLLDYLKTAYPTSPPLDEDTPVIWLQHLNEISLDSARRAAHRWVERERWMPTIAELKAECRAVEREDYTTERDTRAAVALEAARVAPETAAENRLRLIAEMREMLKRQAGNVHNHKGPDPCAVCGGRPT